jgi:hypothetical protein
LSLPKITAAPKLLAGLIPVPVIGMVARCTMKTANPIGRGANTCAKMKITTKLIIRSSYNDKPANLLDANTVQISSFF